MRVLLVEDDREAARYLSKALDESGHSVKIAHDGEEGLEYARSKEHDVLIVDRMLPRLDGLALIETLAHGIHWCACPHLERTWRG